MFRKKRKEPASAPAVPAPVSAPLPLPAPFLSKEEAAKCSGLTLAFLGDAVWELLVRSSRLASGDPGVQALHEKTIAAVNASFQASAAERLLPFLSAEEAGVYRRGRNASPGHVPKNKSGADYHGATGLEALFGWLYASGETQRLYSLFELAMKTEETE